MNEIKEQEFAKKIIQALDSQQLSNDVKHRLMLSRQQALRNKKEHTNKINYKDNILVLVRYNQHFINSLFLFSFIAFVMFLFTSTSTSNWNTPQALADIDMQILTDEHPIEYWLNPELNRMLKNDN